MPLPSARLVPKGSADQRVVARAALGRGVRRGAGLVWQLLKLSVIGVVLIAVVGVALHVLQTWGEAGDPPPPLTPFEQQPQPALRWHTY